MTKTVLITGASSGIGKATAIYFQANHWNVAATMRNPQMENELSQLGNVHCFTLDVTQPETIQKAIQDAIKTFGPIDVLVNNAAYSLTGPFEGATAQQIQNLYDVDVFGVMNVTREILPHFRKNKSGRIINISSLGGVIGMPMSSFYASAKFAIEGFSESVRYELEKENIFVKVVEPGAIRTNFAANAIIVRKPDVASYEKAMEKRLAEYETRIARLNNPIVVAKEIYKAATDNGNKFRYLAGNDAKLYWNIHQILPFSLFTALVRRVVG